MGVILKYMILAMFVLIAANIAVTKAYPATVKGEVGAIILPHVVDTVTIDSNYDIVIEKTNGEVYSVTSFNFE